MITSNEIRSKLKRWDGWFNKVSTTKAILDPQFEQVPRSELAQRIEDATKEILKFFSATSMGSIYKDRVSDCENITLWGVAFFQMAWRKSDNHTLEPAIFRCVVETSRGIHSIAMCFTDDGIVFIDFQNGSMTRNEKVLAVT